MTNTTVPGTPAPTRSWLPLCAALCLLAGLAPIWLVRYVPMVDLPEHAFQVYVWMHHDEPLYRGLYEINWFTPYLLGYALTRPLAALFGIHAALKIVVSGCVVGLYLATDRLAAWSGGSRWFALLAIPLAFGYSFYWGFLNFLVGAPFAVLTVGLALRRASRPTRANAIALFAAGAAVFSAHVLALGLAALAAAAVALTRTRSFRPAVRAVAPLLALLPAFAAWCAVSFLGPRAVGTPPTWLVPPLAHLRLFPNLLLAVGRDRQSYAFVVIVLVALLALGARVRAGRVLAGAWVVAVLLWMFFPDEWNGAALLRDRFAVFVALFALAGLSLPTSRRARRAVQTTVVVAVLTWCAILVGHFDRFDRDARGLDTLIARIPPGQSLMKLVFDPVAHSVPGNPRCFLHHPVWYNVLRGGRPSYEFAIYPHVLFRFVHMPAGSMSGRADWQPDSMLWTRVAGRFPYLIVRTSDPLDLVCVAHEAMPLRLTAQAGKWSLFARDTTDVASVPAPASTP